MGFRKKTPDILGSLLGGSPSPPPPPPPPPVEDTPPPVKEEATAIQESPTASPDESADIEYGAGLLSSAAAKLKAASKVLDRQQILDWLSQMQQNFGGDAAIPESPPAETSLTFRAVEWAQRHLKAVATATSYQANGLNPDSPYQVDICAHLKGERFRPDMNLWIDCKTEHEQVTPQDILEFVKKATDVFHAARTDKQEFGFDRIMIVSMAPFEKDILDIADEYGVICVFYDRTSFIIQSDPYWKLKPKWLKDAEANRR